MQQKWYQKQRNIILLLIFLWPLGLVLMWKYTNWSKILKTILTIVLIFVGTAFFSGLLGLSGSTANTSTTNNVSIQEAAEDTKPATQQESSQPDIATLSTELANTAIAKRSADSKQCLVEHTADSTKFSGDKALAQNATVLFVETGKKVFADQNCGEFVFYYNASTESNEPTRIATFSVYKETFNAYDWDTLKGKAVGVQLEQDEVLGIPITKDLKPENFVY